MKRRRSGVNAPSQRSGPKPPPREELQAARQRLPIWTARGSLLKEVAASSTLVLTGETGSGKTTQIPQFLYAAGYTSSSGMIGITQPRRVAALTVAQRVADEMGSTLGGTVGYSVRFDDRTSAATRIKYLTDGMLLREAMLDADLKRYALLIVDEAHERSLQTDVMLAVLKTAQARRAATKRPLKLLVMSATLEVDLFCDFFPRAPAVQLLGRTFPVQVLYTEEPQADYVEAALRTVMQIHVEETAGDVLVFLSGQEEIEAAVLALEQRAQALDHSAGVLLPLPLYAALPAARRVAYPFSPCVTAHLFVYVYRRIPIPSHSPPGSSRRCSRRRRAPGRSSSQRILRRHR